MEITPKVFEVNGFVYHEGIGHYHPKHYNIKFQQLFAPDAKDPLDDTALINVFVVTVNGELHLTGKDATEIDSLEKLKSFYASLNINDIWK